MAVVKQLYSNKEKDKLYPITHVNAVFNDDGDSIGTIIEDIASDVAANANKVFRVVMAWDKNEDCWRSDKTASEIATAYNAGKIVFAVTDDDDGYQNGSGNIYILAYCDPGNYAVFSRVSGNYVSTIENDDFGGSTVYWHGDGYSLITSNQLTNRLKIQSLTNYSQSTPLAVNDTYDQAFSKLNRIIEDDELVTATALTDLNDRKVENFVVNVTATYSSADDSWTVTAADKTFAEVKEACEVGKNVTCRVNGTSYILYLFSYGNNNVEFNAFETETAQAHWVEMAASGEIYFTSLPLLSAENEPTSIPLATVQGWFE